jgi:hypothetical protein
VSFVLGYEGPDQAVNQVRTNDADPGLPECGRTALYHRRVADPMIAPAVDVRQIELQAPMEILRT